MPLRWSKTVLALKRRCARQMLAQRSEDKGTVPSLLHRVIIVRESARFITAATREKIWSATGSTLFGKVLLVLYCSAV